MRLIIVVLIRTNWRKMFVVGAILTICSVVIQIPSLPYPLTKWILPRTTIVSSYKHLNTATYLIENHPLSVQYARALASLNSFANLNRLVVISNEQQRVSPRWRRKQPMKSTMDTPPSPPYIVRKLPDHFVSSLFLS